MSNRLDRRVIHSIILDNRLKFTDVPMTRDEAIRTNPPGVIRVALIGDTVQRLVSKQCSQSTTKLEKRKGLEIGAGYGELVVSLAKVFPEIEWHAVEHPDRKYLQRQDYQQMLNDAPCRLRVCDVTREQLPYPDNSFDFVFFSEVLEHLPVESVVPVLRELRRVLVNHGHLIATSPNLGGLLYRTLMFFGRSPFDPPVPCEYAPRTYGHIRLYTTREFCELGQHVNLAPLKVVYKTWMLPYYVRLKPVQKALLKPAVAIEWILGTFFPAMRDSWLVVMQKREK